MQKRSHRSIGRTEHDVVIIGGAFSGAATALLLKRARPDLRVLVVERSGSFNRKVGESAIELASWFLTKILHLERHLTLEHLPKYGLRFFFANERVDSLSAASELGPLYQTRLPSYHLDRAVLDEHVLKCAVEEGVELWRPARVLDIDFKDGDRSTVLVETETGHRAVGARWVVDATGRKAWLARRKELLQPIPEHPTCALWARFRGVRDMDRAGISDSRVAAGGSVASRGLSTNHLMGPGWWLWVIPLSGGETSIGVVWDERIFRLPTGSSASERLLGFLRSTPTCRELMEGAEMVEGDLHALNDLPYRCESLMGDGWALVGDAAGFLDPLYSAGLDWCGLTISRTTSIILRSFGKAPELPPAELGREIDNHNALFRRSYDHWFKALYRNKYYYIGDAELMGIALRLDVSMYYFGIVTPPYRSGEEAFEPPFSNAVSVPFYHMIRFINWRLGRLGRIRMAAGTWGRRNAGMRVLLPGFGLGPANLLWLPGVLMRLLFLEIRSIPDRFRALWRKGRMGSGVPAPDPSAR